jgi:hypothetical protein
LIIYFVWEKISPTKSLPAFLPSFHPSKFCLSVAYPWHYVPRAYTSSPGRAARN